MVKESDVTKEGVQSREDFSYPDTPETQRCPDKRGCTLTVFLDGYATAGTWLCRFMNSFT